MNKLLTSFYARLSTIFMLLILALGAGCIAIAFTSAGHLFDDVQQMLNRDYARSISAELEPLMTDGLSRPRLSGAIHYMMVLNPSVEIYILDARGTILSYFAAPPEKIVRNSIDTAPLNSFITGGGRGLILGPDPRSATRLKPFSAAPMRIAGEPGYVYVILGGQSYDKSLEAIRESYYLRTGLAAFLLALLATLAAGLSLFFLLTRRLRSLSQAVKGFQRGELDRRVEARGADEIGDLGRSFNDMAAAIQAGVEKLRLSERRRSELIANISHDLRSPLASIRGYLETVLLKDSQLDPEQRRRFLEVSLKNVGSLQRLVEELFELVKLETRQVQPKRESVQLTELAQDVVLKLRPQADLSRVSLTADLSPGVPRVSADIGMIERVFTNLIENALRFTPSGGSVRVSVSRKNGTVEALVSDTGAGIAPEDLPHVFERFYRADRSRDRSTGGAGLGLSIAKQIVELHGGLLEAESGSAGGASFRFTLPVSS
jgi:signal transduction histidine kinase